MPPNKYGCNLGTPLAQGPMRLHSPMAFSFRWKLTKAFPPSLARLSPSQEEILKPCKFLATNAAFIHQITDLPRRVSFQAPAHSPLSRTLQVAPHNEAHASRKSSLPRAQGQVA